METSKGGAYWVDHSGVVHGHGTDYRIVGDDQTIAAELNSLAVELADEKAENARLREAMNISPDDCGRIMHKSWMRTKAAQGFHRPPPNEKPCEWCHADLIPWDQLPEKQKDINRHAFDDVIAEIRRRALLTPKGPPCSSDSGAGSSSAGSVRYAASEGTSGNPARGTCTAEAQRPRESVTPMGSAAAAAPAPDAWMELAQTVAKVLREYTNEGKLARHLIEPQILELESALAAALRVSAHDVGEAFRLLVAAAQPFLDEVKNKVPGRLHDKDWNPGYHIEISITIAEAQAMDKALVAARAAKGGAS